MKPGQAFARLEQRATALYGENWMSALARDTNRNWKTISRWKKDDAPLRDNHTVFADVNILIERKIAELKALQRA